MKIQLGIVVLVFVALSQCAPPNPCDPDPCDRGTCFRSSSNTDGFICSCEEGFSGATCQHGPCSSNPCIVGLCFTSSIRNSFTCMCPPHRTGASCEIVVDGCTSNPCLNDATCMVSRSNSANYLCLCTPGFYGLRCHLQVTTCVPANPCQHDGLCFPHPSSSNGQYCVCQSGFAGEFCENDVMCESSPCLNGGTCLSSSDGYSCQCDDLFGGAQCEQLMTCALSPCRNGGSCFISYDNGVNYMCKCLDHFKGKTCEKPDPCSSNPCADNHVCLMEDDGSYSCMCRCGTNGTCGNSGSGGNGSNTDGTSCEQLLRESGNCAGRGRCEMDLAGRAFCRCNTPYFGAYCQYMNTTNGGSNGGDNSNGGTKFDRSFMCPDTDDLVGCNSVFTEMNRCSQHGCCSTDLRGGAKCRCYEGYRGNTCHITCNGTSNCGSDGTGTDGTGTGGIGTGTDGDGDVRPQVDNGGSNTQYNPSTFMCPGTVDLADCPRVFTDSNGCNNRGCCSSDQRGGAKCHCGRGYRGSHCQITCDDTNNCGSSHSGSETR